MAKKADIQSENFDLFFCKQAESISNDRKYDIPSDIAKIIWSVQGKIRKGSLRYVTFLQKLFVLCRLMNKKFYIVIEGEQGIEDFPCMREAAKSNESSIGAAEELLKTGGFVIGSKQFSQTMDYLASLSDSPAMNYLTKLKGEIKNPVVEHKSEMKYLVRLFANWESNKKKWIKELGLEMADIYVLFCVYLEGEITSSKIYKEQFVDVFNARSTKIRLAFPKLRQLGLVEKIGERFGAKLKIAPKGIELVGKIIKTAINI